MSPAVEDFLSPSSTRHSYFQNPNYVQKHPTDSGIFNTSFNPVNSSKLDFDCSKDAATASAASAATVRPSRRKHVKVKKQSSSSDSVSTQSVSNTGNTFGFVFNGNTSGSLLNSSLGQTGNGEQKSDGDFLDSNTLRFTIGATDNSKLGKTMGSEEVQNSGNKFQPGNLSFVFGADEKVNTRKVSETGANKFGKVNGVDFMFGANMNNGVMNSNSSNLGYENGPDGVAFHVNDCKSGGTVGRSGVDGFMKVENFTNKADSHLVNSMSGLNLGSRASAEGEPLMNNNPKAEEINTADIRRYENLDFVFSANLRGNSSNIQKQESKDNADNLVPEGTKAVKLDGNVVFGTSGDLGMKDFGMSSMEMKSGDSVNRNTDSGINFGNIKVNGVFHMGNQNDKRSSFKESKKLSDETNILKSEDAGKSDYLKKKYNNNDSVLDGNYSFVFGSNLGNAFSDNPISKVSDEKKESNIHDPTKVSSTNKINDSDKLFVFGSGKRNISCERSDTAASNGELKSSDIPHGEPKSSTTGLGFVPEVHFLEAPATNGAGITNDFSFLSKVGGLGTSFTGFNTPNINLATSFTSDMFPGLGKKLEFSKSHSINQRKLKKTKVKLRQSSRNCPQGVNVEECCSPMDVSPYGGADCAPTSTDPATSQVNNEDPVDATEKLSEKNLSSSSFDATSYGGDNVTARQRPNQKKYKMKTGCGTEFTTPKMRVHVSREHESTSRGHTKATNEETCDEWRKRGNNAYKSGDLSEAEVCYSKGISLIQHTETPDVCIEPLLLCYSNRAATRMALGRMREGLKDCRMAAALDPNFVKANLRSANCHLLLGEIEDAICNYKKCLESGNTVCLDRRIAIDAADGIQKAQKVTEQLKLCAELLQQKTYESATNALGIIADALSVSCYSEKLLNMKGDALLVLGKHKEVVQLCEQTLALAEKNFATGGVTGDTNVDNYDCKNSYKLWRWKLMAKSYFRLGKLEMALDLIEKHEQLRSTEDKSNNVGPEESLISLGVTIRELLHCKNAGNEAFQNGKHTEAVEHYTAAISKSMESHSFAAVCFCNRAAAHQALGEIVDAIGDCSIAIALDESYPKALSRRATLRETIRDYKHAADDLQRLISIYETQSKNNTQKSATPSRSTNGSVKDLRRARHRLSSIEEKAKKERSLDLYLILGLKPSDASAEVKKAYRKAALRHHPDKAGQILARGESGSDGQQWKLIAESIQMDADKLFKMIGEAYAVLSDSTKRSKYDMEEEMWDDMDSNVASSSRRASEFYNSPYERRSSQESSRRSYSNSHYYYWQDSRKTYHSSYPRW